LDDPFAQIDKKLDEVVGKRFDGSAGGDPVRRVGARLAGFIVAGACAVGAMSVIVWVIESHRMPPQGVKPAAQKPVMIQIVPDGAKR
jgi:hypothetical protein